MVNGSGLDVSVGEQDELQSSDSRGITHPMDDLIGSFRPWVNGSVPDVSVGEEEELHSTDSRGITHPWVIL